jgi:hypothetical protein
VLDQDRVSMPHAGHGHRLSESLVDRCEPFVAALSTLGGVPATEGKRKTCRKEV